MSFTLITAPVSLVVVTKLSDYNTTTKRKDIDASDDLSTAGMVHREIVDGKVIIYIDVTQPPEDLHPTLVHESVHAYRLIREHMGIGYDDEIAAYGIESIYRELIKRIGFHAQSKGQVL